MVYAVSIASEQAAYQPLSAHVAATKAMHLTRVLITAQEHPDLSEREPGSLREHHLALPECG